MGETTDFIVRQFIKRDRFTIPEGSSINAIFILYLLTVASDKRSEHYYKLGVLVFFMLYINALKVNNIGFAKKVMF